MSTGSGIPGLDIEEPIIVASVPGLSASDSAPKVGSGIFLTGFDLTVKEVPERDRVRTFDE